MDSGKQKLGSTTSTRPWLWLAVLTIGLLFWLGGQGTAGAADPASGIEQQPPGTIPEATPQPTFAPKPTSRPDRDNNSSNRPTATPLPSGPAQGTPQTDSSAVLTGTINVPVLNVRRGPGTAYAIIGRIGRDAVVTVVGRNADSTWLKFCCVPNTQTQGWISAQFVTPSYTAKQAATIPIVEAGPPVATATPTASPIAPGARTGVVSAVALNMREAPSTDAAVLGKLRSGATVTVLARNDAGDWWLVCCVPGGEENAWVAAEFVTPNFTDAASLPVTTGRTAPAEAEAPAAATPEPTPTQALLEETTLEVAVVQDPPAALQGEQIMLAFTVTNTGSAEAAMVELSFELPAGLAFVSASADGGEVVQEDADSGAAIAVVTWESLPAGESAGAKVTVSIAEDVADGAVLDGAAAVVAENAELASVAVSVGLPPVDPPDFQ